MSGFREDATATSRKQNSVGQIATDLIVLISRLLALVVLIIYLPALVLAGLLVLGTSAGPAFVSKAYRRRDGNLIYLYEFRTECIRTLQETPVGAFLRRADLARLPRLAN